MKLSARSATQKDDYSRHLSQLPTQSFCLPSFLEAMNPGLATGRFPGQYALLESIRHQRYRQALLLVEAGAQIDSRNGSGFTPLICACAVVEDHRLRAKFVQLFLDAGADPNAQDWKGLTALMHAASMGRLETVVQLLKHPKTDLNISDESGDTAVAHAAKNGQAETLVLILNAYRHVHDSVTSALEHENARGYTAIDVAISNNHDEIAHLLELAKRNPDRNLDVNICKTLVKDTSTSANKLECSDVDVDRTESTDQGDLPTIVNQGQNNTTKDENRPDATARHIEANGRKVSYASTLPLLSLSGLAPSEPWEWDVGASGRNVKSSGQRKSITTSKSLTDSTMDDDDDYAPNESYKQVNQRCSMEKLSASFGGVSSFGLKSSVDARQNTVPSKTQLHLPPIPRRLMDYEKTLKTSALNAENTNKEP